MFAMLGEGLALAMQTPPAEEQPIASAPPGNYEYSRAVTTEIGVRDTLPPKGDG